MLTKDELNWIKFILSDYEPFEVSPSYYYRLKTVNERNKNKGDVRKELDNLRGRMLKVTPEELLELKDKNERERRGIFNFCGIYIMQNNIKNIYYIGQAEKVFDRAYKHFVLNEGNPRVYKDYNLGDEFIVSLIPLENTSFLSLNELEDNAIRAYDSFQNGYNRMPGNVVDKHIFKNDDYQKVAELLLDRIKGSESFSSLSNGKKRVNYVSNLLSELELPKNIHFILGFAKLIKEYQKANKKIIYKQ